MTHRKTLKKFNLKAKNGEFYQPILQVQIDPNDEETYIKITSDHISCYSDSNLNSSDIRVYIKLIIGWEIKILLILLFYYSDSTHMR